jgi:predicted Zn-ribbon and HTH transcriptional regulator
MGRRLATIAREINEDIPGFTATIERGYCNTDRKMGRLRWPGKGREGNRLIVRNEAGKVVLDHNAAETYRNNAEVEEWLGRLKDTIDRTGPQLRTFCPHCRKRLQEDFGRRPFGHCPQCKSSFLLTEAHY